MELIFASIVIAAIISGVLIWYGWSGYKVHHEIAFILGVVIGFITGIAALGYCWAAFSWFAAGHKAQIINREYGTHYTQSEVFYASDVIDTIRQIQRNRVELNGNLMNGADNNQNNK